MHRLLSVLALAAGLAGFTATHAHAAVVPEPASVPLLVLALLCTVAWQRWSFDSGRD